MDHSHSPVPPLLTWPPVPGNHSVSALFVVTADGVVCKVNDTARSWFDAAAEPMEALDRFLGVIDDLRRRELQAFIADLKTHRLRRELRLTLHRHDGESFSALLIATPLAGPDGAYLGFDATLLDLSRWQDREALVVRTRDESLRLRCQANSHALAVIQREMESLSQAVAHDIRAPLRHIGGYLGLARERATEISDDVLAAYAEQAQAGLSRMTAMVEALQDYLYLCRARPALQEVPLGALVQEVKAHLPSAAQDVRVQWDIAPDLPSVQADPMLLAQVFRHLLDNAVKFSRDAAQPRVTVGHERGSDGTFTFFVRDNGTGFDRQRASRLFLLFQRQHHSQDFEGLGVGLAMAARIVEHHGGSIHCDATPGGGCQVRFTLPDLVSEGVLLREY
ncbi:MAG: hypothetical protein KF871_05685 [Hydrogenophaga sp.]|uniref:sensor histidine kinase n=1 Tax=Hydrogenophaga sp. TaxID=1904254 RepID=UPI001D9E7870|nr:ATP-binding protein [Hydrogenophaga sp.]MBX3609370.1 hypothetical protein [Hydrogenophaga sp.]